MPKKIADTCFELFAGVIVFCVASGVAIGYLGENTRIMFDIFTAINEVVMTFVHVIIW